MVFDYGCSAASSLKPRNYVVRCLALFGKSEGGLVTVEWVALSAGVAIAAIIIGVLVMDGLAGPAVEIGNQLTVTPPPP